MKKTRFITLVLVAAIMLMGAGYAYWTDSITISNTVEAGEFDVDFVSASPSNWNENDGGYQIVTAKKVNNNKINVTMENMYPQAQEVEFEFVAKNDGTIPAVVREVKLNNGWRRFPQELKDHIEVSGLSVDIVNQEREMTINNRNEKCHICNKPINPGKGGCPGHDDNDVPGETTFKLGELETKLNEVMQQKRLEKDEQLVIQYSVKLPTTVENKDRVETKSGSFDIQIDWRQHNDI